MFKKIFNWFFKIAWPVILKFLIKYSDEIVMFIFDFIKEKMDEKHKMQQEEEMKKAQENYEMAKKETNPDLKKQYVEVAIKYQDSANSHEQKMKAWNEYLDSLKEEVMKEVKQNTSRLKAEDIFKTSKEDNFELKNKSSYLQLGTSEK
jgi:hypothetical protein